jgi:hypothetical protein
MPSSYQPRDPRGKLHEVTSQWMAKVRLHGQEPNREVMFGADGESTEQTRAARGFLLSGVELANGFLVLEDGDVLSIDDGSWLNAPTDDLVSALGRSITDAMYRRQGLFAAGREVEWVPDRRAAHEAFAGPERRAYATLWVHGDERPFAAHPRPHVSAIA